MSWGLGVCCPSLPRPWEARHVQAKEMHKDHGRLRVVKAEELSLAAAGPDDGKGGQFEKNISR